MAGKLTVAIDKATSALESVDAETGVANPLKVYTQAMDTLSNSISEFSGPGWLLETADVVKTARQLKENIQAKRTKNMKRVM